MNYELLIFTDSPLELGLLTLDNGFITRAHPAVHMTGRPGYGFTIPENAPQANGCKIELTAKGKVTIKQRAILFVKNDDVLSQGYPWAPQQMAALAVDDFHFKDEKICPPCPEPPPIPPPTPIPIINPLDIINKTYKGGNYDLSTKEGCGKFTEDCVTNLHTLHSNKWGHIRKFPPQNMYNGHAVDAIMLLENVEEINAGIYDIILASESPSAKPQFIFKEPPKPELWYYPA